MNFDIARIVMTLAVAIPSLVIHEFCHGLVATALGDPTPRWEGRLTLNPARHFDPIGALMILISFSSGFGFGWARPVMVDPSHFRKPGRDMMLVAIAGPASNFALALIFGLALRFFRAEASVGLQLFLLVGTVLNISLALFNLLPIPPLDGSRVVRYFLRGPAYNAYRAFEQYGMLVLFALILIPGFISTLIGVPLAFLVRLIVGT